MIREIYPFALKVVQGNEVEILQNVIYESEHGTPCELIGFDSIETLRSYMIEHDLVEFEQEA